MTHTIFIDGEAGTTGLEIRERLEARGDLELMLLGDRRRDVEARREALNSADAVILCLPDDAAKEAVSMIENSSGKVIIVADHTKMNCVSSFLTCPLNRIDMIVTDWMAPPAFCQEIEDQGICVVRVQDQD